MISNYEFIKTQAFELSWAVFRCTELFSQEKLRKEVEAAAVELIADSGTIADMSEGELPRIEKLTALIRLAESVGQIASVNANVLYRELDNLAKAVRLEAANRREKKNIATSLDHMFTNSAYAQNLPANVQTPDVAMAAPRSAIPVQSGIQSPARSVEAQNTDSAVRQSPNIKFGSIEQLLSTAAKSPQPIGGGVDSANANHLNQFVKSAEVSADAYQQSPVVRQSSVAIASAEMHGSAGASGQAGSWQYVILQKVKDLGQTTTKELAASFPEISERTIRFYLQKPVDNGAIDRIGSTGPGAAYKAKI